MSASPDPVLPSPILLVYEAGLAGFLCAAAEALLACLDAFRSDLPRLGDHLVYALSRLSVEGCRAMEDWGDPVMALVAKAALRTRAQTNLLLGILRFSELEGGIWYARIRSDCDLLPLLGGHFADRFPGSSFVIEDADRGSALFHSPGLPPRMVEGFALSKDDLPLTDGEKAIRAGWRRYFESVAIAERANPRLQRSRMPKKYWNLLPEMDEMTKPGIFS